jgi:sugar lactone lactonase YvrE
MRTAFSRLALCATLLAASALAAGAQSLKFGAPHLIEGGFERPYGLAVDDTEGTLIVADTGNHRIRTTALADLAGSYSFAEHGFVADRTDPAALVDPMGVASDGSGNLYVANTRAGELQHYTLSGGSYTLQGTFASSNPQVVDGTAIDLPRDVAIGPGGAVYLLDSGNNRILRADGPADTSWEVFHTGSDWANPYGLDVDGAGVVFVADTGNHRIVRIDGSSVTVIGGWGEGNGQFRYPRDVAADQHGRLFVADTFNHRIQVLAADGHHLRSLGHAPALGTLNKVVVDASDRVFTVDSDANRVVAFLGASVPAPFDPFMRDFVGDDGAEPSNDAYLISSPDILVRHAPDVDLAAAAASGLEAWSFQQPKFDAINYVYVALNNRGTQIATDSFVKLYWYDPDTAGQFPEDWSETGFYKAWSSPSSNMPTNVLPVTEVLPGDRTVVGPLLWRPPVPESATGGDGAFRLAARINNPFDFPPQGASATMARDSNNVTERPVAVLRGPFAEGVQNTLVVRVHFPNIAQPTDEAQIIAQVGQLDGWVQEVSWGLASVEPLYRGPIVPGDPSTHYDEVSGSLLVDLAEDVLDKLITSEPAVLEGSEPGEQITRVILVTNDASETDGWAISAPWPYNVGGETRYLTVSVHGTGTQLPEYAHGMARQFGMQDLFAHYNATFSRPYADGWDTMARPNEGVHPLVWSKELANWVSFSDADVLFVPRPDPGTTWDNGGAPIHLYEQASQTGEEGGPIAVAFGLTHGVTSFVDETAFYYVEARRDDDPEAPADAALPGSGVLMYYANRLIPSGQGPVILRDHVPGGDLTDAAIPVGGSETPGGTGLTVAVSAGTDGADYDLTATYSPPATDYDVYMEQGDPNWLSPDIWVDNQQDGYDIEEGRSEEDRGNQGIAGEENRVYARVRNQGPADAHDVEVAYFFSEPYHTVGGEGSFDEFRSVFLSTVPGGGDAKAYVEWTPQTGTNPHTCALVRLRRLFNDTNPENNWAQRNLDIDHSVHGSPYTPVSFPFSFRNEEDRAELIYFRVDGVPDDWTWSVSPEKAHVQPGGLATGTLTLQPPEGAPDCTEHPVFVTGWAARERTLVRLGGATVRVDLRQETRIDVKTRIVECRGDDLERLAAERKKALSAGLSFAGWNGETQQCLRTVSFGCTDPKLPHTEIVLRYEGPDGVPVYKTVKTDANGCYEDFNVVVEGGDHGVTAIYPGDDCLGPSSGETGVDIPLDEIDRGEPLVPDGDARTCLAGLSFDVKGETDVTGESKGDNLCKVAGLEQAMKLDLRATGLFDDALEGRMSIVGLGTLRSPRHDGAGQGAGRFLWEGDGFAIQGSVAGLYGVGSSRVPPPDCPGCVEPARMKGHWELQLRGTVMKGRDAGALVRLTMVLDDSGAVVAGAAEGSLERGCDISKRTIRDRLRREDAAEASFVSPLKSCGGALSCLDRISKTGEGEARLDQRGVDTCRSGDCGAAKTWQAVRLALKGNPALEDGATTGAAELTIDRWVTIAARDGTGRGFHGGRFVMRTESGAVIEGEMTGTTYGSAHRPPAAKPLADAVAKGRHVGRMTGTVVSGEGRGARVEARYQLQEIGRDGRVTKLRAALDGWVVPECGTRGGGFRLRPATDLRLLPVDPLTRIRDLAREEIRPRPYRPQSRVPRETPPKGLFREIDAMPRAAVRAFQEAEGGRLDRTALFRLQSADRRFRTLGDGRAALLRRDFATMLSPLPPNAEAGTKPSQAFADWLIRGNDRDGDKRLTAEEAPDVWQAYGALDTGDGALDARELLRAHDINIDRNFRAADANEDDKVDFREFALWWRSLP